MAHSPGFLKLVDTAKARIKQIDVRQAGERLRQNPDAVLVDIREESEWENGHVQDAMYLGKGVIERDIEEQIPDKDREILLYCGGGFRSALAADALQQMGYTNVYSVDGGYRAFKEIGTPMESNL